MSWLSQWWNKRTEHTSGNVVMVASETKLLWGLVTVHRFRAYLTSEIDLVGPETPHRTWRSVKVGPFTLMFRFPKFVEDACE